jgi:hypothetical protein
LGADTVPIRATLTRANAEVICTCLARDMCEDISDPKAPQTYRRFNPVTSDCIVWENLVVGLGEADTLISYALDAEVVHDAYWRLGRRAHLLESEHSFDGLEGAGLRPEAIRIVMDYLEELL